MKYLKLAEAHSSNRKLVSFCVSEAARLALIVNATVVPLGLLTVLSFVHLDWYLYIVLGIAILLIGVMLAIVVDGMTLGACARLRQTYVQKLEIESRYNVSDKLEPELIAKRKAELAQLEPSIDVNKKFILVFSLISIAGGELFWHWLLSGLPMYMSIGIGTLFSIAVSTTLIASELLKYQNEKIVGESIESAKFHRVALTADNEEKAIGELQKNFDKSVEEIGKTELLATVSEEKVIDIYNTLLFEGSPVIKNRLEADRKAKEREENKRREIVERQIEMIAGPIVEKDTGPIQAITEPKFKKLGNRERVAAMVEKYGEDYVRQNITTISQELDGMHKTTIYSHLKAISRDR